jgi:hypothetical protein
MEVSCQLYALVALFPLFQLYKRQGEPRTGPDTGEQNSLCPYGKSDPGRTARGLNSKVKVKLSRYHHEGEKGRGDIAPIHSLPRH